MMMMVVLGGAGQYTSMQVKSGNKKAL